MPKGMPKEKYLRVTEDVVGSDARRGSITLAAAVGRGGGNEARVDKGGSVRCRAGRIRAQGVEAASKGGEA